MGSKFRLPGPTPLPPQVLAAMQREMIPHRGSDSRELYATIVARTKEIHASSGDAIIWPGSGSAGWEAAVVNLFSPGDSVLCAINGNFGERFAAVATAFQLDVQRLAVPWGEAIMPDALAAALDQHDNVKAVFITHNETSTGVTNPLAELAAVARDYGALVVVDAVSSAAGLPLLMDEWGLDFVISGSQKAWMCPPGLLIAAVGPKALEAYEQASFPRFFWDLGTARKAAADGLTPTTPPLTLLYAFDAALEMILTEGVESVWRRHHEVGSLTRTGIKALGLRLLADEAYASDTVTAFLAPEGMPAQAIIDVLYRDHGVVVAGGQGHLADSLVRIGHMGWVDRNDVETTLDALGNSLAALGRAPAGVGVAR